MKLYDELKEHFRIKHAVALAALIRTIKREDEFANELRSLLGRE